MKSDISKIQWPTGVLANEKFWSINCRIVKYLCELGRVTEWINGRGGIDTYMSMPYKYKVKGIDIEFLPHWGFIQIGGEPFFNVKIKEHLIKAISLRKEYLKQTRCFIDIEMED